MRVVRVIAWVVMVLLCIFAFVRTGSVALCGIAAAAFLIPVVGWAMALLASRSFSASLACATTTAKESPVTATLTLANESVFPVACVRAVVNARNLLTSQAMTTQVNVSCGPRSTVDVPLEFSSALCGRVECAVESVQLFDPFRLFSRTVACSAQRRFTVMPGLHDVLLRDVYAASPLSDTTVFSPYAKGTDLSEVFGLREYEAGDELKRIHWKLSEKLDQMIVRDASLPLDNALLLFWDKNLSSTATGASPGSDEAAHRADAMAEVMLALMEQLARADVTFEVASNDIPASRCIRAFMTDENDIYELIGQLLSSPLAPAAEPGLLEYERFFGALTCSRLLYVCCERPADFELLLGQREAVLLICDGGSDIRTVGPITVIHFPADGARFALEMLGVL